MKIPEDAKEISEGGIVSFATSLKSQANVTLLGSGVILNKDEYLLVDCEMRLARENILKNPNCCLIVYNYKKKIGWKIFGKGKYFDKGEYPEIAKKHVEDEPYKAKGAIVVKIKNIFKTK